MAPDVSRREFIGQAAIGAAALVAAGASGAQAAALPVRVLGRTGAPVPVLAFGGGSRFLSYERDEDAVAVLHEAIDAGVTYVDTAASYGDGRSEARIGQVMRTRRREVWLATKTGERTRDAALRDVEASLRRLQTDRVDLLHIHSLMREDDLAAIEAPDGVLRAMYALRDQKVARFIGMTSHTDGEVMATAIARHDLDCVQIALNPTRADAFEERALPAAVAKRLGIIAMKVTGQDRLNGTEPGRAPMVALLRYALTLPVATAVVGMPTRELLRENVALAHAFSPMPEKEQQRLREQVAPSRAAVEGFFRHHRDA